MSETRGTFEATGVGTRGDGGENLQTAAHLAGWPSPTTPSGGQTPPDGTSATGRTPDGRKVQVTLKDVTALCGWNTPRASEGSNGGPNQAGAGWPTPATRDWKGATLEKWGDNALPSRALPYLIERERRGLSVTILTFPNGAQLNPAHSRWLMGLPPAWDDCAPTETLSTLKRRRLSSSQPWTSHHE